MSKSYSNQMFCFFINHVMLLSSLENFHPEHGFEGTEALLLQGSHDLGKIWKAWKRGIFERKENRENLEKSGLYIFSGAQKKFQVIYCKQPPHIFVCSDAQEALVITYY